VIAVDTSSLITYLAGTSGPDVPVVEQALVNRQVCLPPVVLTELLSDPKLPKDVASVLLRLPLLPVLEGYWERAGALRARVLAMGRRAPLADTLIAQTSLDNDIGLVTRDADLRPFQRVAKLRLIP
jgi:hypothetical protein